MPRIIAIGDVHGCLPALAAILKAIDPAADDTLVMLGDYVDRGPDSKAVIDGLLAVAKKCHLIPILGNHEEMLLSIIDGQIPPEAWLRFGGLATLESYGVLPGLTEAPASLLAAIPPEHVAFLRSCRDYHETDTHLLLHANYDPARPLAEQDPATIRWRSLRDSSPAAHCSGKTAILGHTPTKSGEIFDLGYLKGIDTYCYGGGWLTALDLASGRSGRPIATARCARQRLEPRTKGQVPEQAGKQLPLPTSSPSLKSQACRRAASRKDPPAHGGVQPQHAAAVADECVAVLPHDVVVFALSGQIIDCTRFFVFEQSQAAVANAPRARQRSTLRAD